MPQRRQRWLCNRFSLRMTATRNLPTRRRFTCAISGLFDQLQMPSNYDPTRFSRRMHEVNTLLH